MTALVDDNFIEDNSVNVNLVGHNSVDDNLVGDNSADGDHVGDNSATNNFVEDNSVDDTLDGHNFVNNKLVGDNFADDDLAGDECADDNLEYLSKEFCVAFVSVGMETIERYNEEEFKRGKCGKMEDLANKAAGVVGAGVGVATFGLPGAVAGAKVSSFMGSKFCEMAMFISNKAHKQKAKKISERFGYYKFNNNNFKYVPLISLLMDVALKIVSSFEWQFLQISSDNRGHIMHKLAIDAFSRAINYINDNEIPISSLVRLGNVMIKGILKGNSKETLLSNLLPRRWKGKQFRGQLLPHPGKTCQTLKCKWTSYDLWTKPGVVNGQKFLSNDKCDSNNYGYRLIFFFEDSSTFPIEEDITEKYEYKVQNNFKFYKQLIATECQQLDVLTVNLLHENIKLILENKNILLEFFEVQKEFKNLLVSKQTAALTLDNDYFGKFWPFKNCLINSFVIRYHQEGKLLIEHVREKIETSGELVITGYVGVGKTTIAKWFSHKYESEYDNIIWIDCVQKNLSSCLKKLAVKLGILNFMIMSLESIALEIYRLLKERRCLFIFDNVEDYATIKSLLPKTKKPFKIHCLMTSRQQIWGRQSDFGEIGCYILPAFSENESNDFFKGEHTVDLKAEEVKELTNELGHHPSLLRNAEAMIKEIRRVNPNYSIDSFIKDYRTNPFFLLQSQRVDDYDIDIFTETKNLYETLRYENYGMLAITILSVIAYIHEESVDINLFLPLGTETEVMNAICLLKSHSIIVVENYCFSVSHQFFKIVFKLIYKNDEETNLEKALGCVEFPIGLPYRKSICEYAVRYPKLLNKFRQQITNFMMMPQTVQEFSNSQIGGSYSSTAACQNYQIEPAPNYIPK